MASQTYLLAAACLALSATAAAAQDRQITLTFAGELAGRPFKCGAPAENLGLSKATAQPADFRFFVSEIEFLRSDGVAVPLRLDQDGMWQYRSVALLDFEDGTGSCSNGTPDRRDRVTGSVPAGDYKGLRFKIGIPFELNHQDPTLAPSPLNLTSMFWTWQGGYKFIKVDFVTKGALTSAATGAAGGGHHGGTMPSGSARPPVASPGFSLHLGSTMCQSPSRTTAPSACANGNRIAVAFDAFDPARNVIVLDPAPVLAGVNIEMNTPDTSPGCMSFPGDPDCLTVFPRLGLAYGDRRAEPQALVRLR
jgi:uncharacterized repeat protein (TIGR04052 family)